MTTRARTGWLLVIAGCAVLLAVPQAALVVFGATLTVSFGVAWAASVWMRRRR